MHEPSNEGEHLLANRGVFFRVENLTQLLVPEEAHEVNRGQLLSNLFRYAHSITIDIWSGLSGYEPHDTWQLSVQLFANFEVALGDPLLNLFRLDLEEN